MFVRLDFSCAQGPAFRCAWIGQEEAGMLTAVSIESHIPLSSPLDFAGRKLRADKLCNFAVPSVMVRSM